MTTKYIRNAKIVVRSLDDEVILVNNELDTIFNLNPIGVAVWNFLQEPRSIEEIINILVLAFPNTDNAQIRTDTEQLIHELMDRELLFKLP